MVSVASTAGGRKKKKRLRIVKKIWIIKTIKEENTLNEVNH